MMHPSLDEVTGTLYPTYSTITYAKNHPQTKDQERSHKPGRIANTITSAALTLALLAGCVKATPPPTTETPPPENNGNKPTTEQPTKKEEPEQPPQPTISPLKKLKEDISEEYPNGKIDGLLNITERAYTPQGADHRELVIEVAEAIYQEITQRSFITDGIKEIQILFNEEYQAKATEYNRPNSIGFSYGGIIVSMGEQSLFGLLYTILHEAGHVISARGSKPFKPYEPDPNRDIHAVPAFLEGQAWILATAGIRALQKYTNINIMTFSDSQQNIEIIVQNLTRSKQRVSKNVLGYLINWLAILEDPELSNLAPDIQKIKKAYLTGENIEEMLEQESIPPLSVEQLMKINDRFIGIHVPDRYEYVKGLLAKLDEYRPLIHAIAQSRLVSDETQEDGLNRSAGLLVP